MKKTNKNLQTLLLIVNLVLLFILPSYLLDVNVNIYAWMTVFVFSLVTFTAIRFALLLHLYYFTFFLFVYIAIYFVQTATGVRFFLHTSSVSEVPQIVFVFLTIHLFSMLLPCLIPKRDKLPGFYYLSRDGCFRVCLAVAFFSVFVATVVDPSAFFSSREEQYLVGSQSNIAKMLVFTAKILPFIALIYVFQKAYQVQQRGVYYFLFVLMLIFAAVFANPVNTPRYISIASLSMLAIFMIATIERTRYLATFVLISPYAFLLLLPLSSLIRHGFNTPGIGAMTSSYTGLEFSSFQMLLDAFNVESVLESSSYFLSAIFIVVPRVIWPSKSEGLGDEIAEASGYVFTNTGVPSVFNAYADYEWVGLVLISFVIGLLMRRASIRDGMSFRDRPAFYSILLFSQVPMLVRGDFSTFMIAVYSFSIFYEGVLMLSRLKFSRSGMTQGTSIIQSDAIGSSEGIQ